MKLFLALMLFSSTALARQYTQCSSDGLYSVVNLPTLEAGTLFLTQGAETDNHALMDLVLKQTEKAALVYSVVNGPFKGELHFPQDVFGKNEDNVNVTLFADGVTYDFSCFSRVYED